MESPLGEGVTRAEVYVDYFDTFWSVASDRSRRYYGEKGPSGHAAGLESLLYFAGLVIELMPDSWQDASVIDAGAGASSAILRTYFRDVTSCDPDPDYLGQVERACAEMGLPPGRWVEGVPTEAADATFYDFGRSERIPKFASFLDLSRKLIWVDDAQVREMLEICTAVCAERGLELRTARGANDNLGRFGAYAIRGGCAPLRAEPEEVEALRSELRSLHTEWRAESVGRRRAEELLRLQNANRSWRVMKPLRDATRRAWRSRRWPSDVGEV